MDFASWPQKNILRRPSDGRKKYFSMDRAESRDFG
jgi:hypothetical protein